MFLGPIAVTQSATEAAKEIWRLMKSNKLLYEEHKSISIVDHSCWENTPGRVGHIEQAARIPNALRSTMLSQ